MFKKILKKIDEHPVISVFGLVILTVVFYLASFSNSFTNWDDPVNILQNPYIASFNFANIKEWFTVPLLGMYSPVVYFSFAIDYAAGNLNPFCYHLSNLILHLVNVYLVQLLLFQFIRKRSVALILALLFAIHPLIISGVTPLSIRSNLLYTLFFLLALRSYFKYIQHGQRNSDIYLTLIFFLLSILSKSAAVIFPVVMLAGDNLYKRQFSWKLVLEKIPFLVISILTGLLSLYFRKDIGLSLNDYTVFDKLILAFYSLSYYSFKWFFPFHFSPLYAYPVKLNGFLPAIYYLSTLWIILAGILVCIFRKNRMFIFGFLFYLLNLLLVIKIIPVGMEFVSDRYGYISSIGLMIMIAGIITQYRSHINSVVMNWLAFICFLYMIWFSVLGQKRQHEWKDAKTLWSTVISKQNNMALAYNNMGVLLADENKLKEAIMFYDKALKAKADYPEVLFNRANAFRKTNNPNQALRDYNLCIQSDPEYYKAILNRGILYKETGNYPAAIRDINKAVSLKPLSAEAYYNRGVIRYELRDFEGALSDFNKSVQLDQIDYQAYANRGAVYYLRGNYQLAMHDLNRAIQINPGFALAYENRARVEVKLNLKDQACSDLKKAVNLGQKADPDLLKSCCNHLP